MDSFYSNRYDFYSLYPQGETVYERNGFDEYPINEYSMFVDAVETIPYDALKIIDIGCGNALLLKHIIRNSKKRIIPFGVDFIKESIFEAKSSVLPEFADNFFCIDAGSYVFQCSFDLVLFDLSILRKDDSDAFLLHIRESGSRYCIAFIYCDVISKLNLSNAAVLLPNSFFRYILYTVEAEQMSLIMMDFSK